MPRDNEPWVKIKIGARRSGKIAALPSDAARLGYFYTLLEAKVQRHMGVFDGPAHFVEVLGRFGRYLPDYIAQGLIHEAPELCPDCRKRNPGMRRGELVVHDYLREQRDPTNATRQADWRDRHRDEAAESNADRNGSTNGSVTESVTPTVTGHVTAGLTATVTGDSRAPESTATGTVTTTRGLTGSLPEEGARADDLVDPVEELETVPWV